MVRGWNIQSDIDLRPFLYSVKAVIIKKFMAVNVGIRNLFSIRWMRLALYQFKMANNAPQDILFFCLIRDFFLIILIESALVTIFGIIISYSHLTFSWH